METDFDTLKFKNTHTYPRHNPKQKRFESHLLDFITESSTFKITETVGFVRMVRGLDPNIWIPSRRTITRQIMKAFESRVTLKLLT